MRIVSDRESKLRRGYREVISSTVDAPSDGMIEFRLKTGTGEYIGLWMTCENARSFCDMLHSSLLYHEEFGEQNVYDYVDRSALGYDPRDYMGVQALRKAITLQTQ